MSTAALKGCHGSRSHRPLRKISLFVTQGRHGTLVYTPADLRLPSGKRTEHPMPHKRYTLAYDISDKPNVAGCLQFEADIRALLPALSLPSFSGLTSGTT